jgi:fatty acid desaturase
MDTAPTRSQTPSAAQAESDIQLSDRFSRIDTAGFLRDLDALRQQVESELGPADLRHLRKIENWGHAASLIGLLTAGLGPNPVSIAALSLSRTTRWLLMHHIGHRGYDKVPGVPKKYTSRFFARGWRRWIDWPDWMGPESWKYEHNVLHHSHTGEIHDPDLLERNAEAIRQSGLPQPLREVIICALGAVWKPVYYSPSNLHALHQREPKGPAGEYSLDAESIKELIFDCYLPYMLLQFVMLPALYLPAGPWAVYSALINSVLADLLANFHSFMVVGPNHTGEDIWRFDSPPADKSQRMLHQVLGTANYRTGGDLNDYLHFWLNYQIEHHLWPDLPMLRYQQLQPKLEALCAEYGIPYLQESVWIRFRKMLDVTTGKREMRRLVASDHVVGGGW